MHKPELPFGHPGRNFDDTPEHFDHRDDRYEPPPVDPPEEGIVHYGPGDRPLCGRESPFAIYTFEPDQVAGLPGMPGARRRGPAAAVALGQVCDHSAKGKPRPRLTQLPAGTYHAFLPSKWYTTWNPWVRDT